MEVGVKVMAENPLTGDQRHTSTAYLTFVAMGQDGKPCPVPPLLLITAEEKRRWKEAILRRKHRLEKHQTSS